MVYLHDCIRNYESYKFFYILIFYLDYRGVLTMRSNDKCIFNILKSGFALVSTGLQPHLFECSDENINNNRRMCGNHECAGNMIIM